MRRTSSHVAKSRRKISIPLFAEKPSHPSAPLAGQAAIARSDGPGRPFGRRLGALPLTEASTVAGWPRAGRRAILAAMFLSALASSGGSANAQSIAAPAPSPRIVQGDPFTGFVTEAAQRFGIPSAWIRTVMLVESNDNASAVSPKGAIGLMQIMPGTYQDMRSRYGLGADPFQPHDNILAGTAYLREMLDCYGMSGFLAAYNAGPEQYDKHLATGRALPDETILYVARITPMLSGVQSGNSLLAPSAMVDWRHSSLFSDHVSVAMNGEISAVNLQSGGNMTELLPTAIANLTPRSSGMFTSQFPPASP
jgi:soluble lytic murein transglycosylase-like protein